MRRLLSPLRFRRGHMADTHFDLLEGQLMARRDFKFSQPVTDQVTAGGWAVHMGLYCKEALASRGCLKRKLPAGGLHCGLGRGLEGEP